MILYPLFGVLAYALGASLCAILRGKTNGGLFFSLIDLIFAAPTLFAALYYETVPDHAIPFRVHSLFAAMNAGIYLVFSVLHGLKAEGYRFFRMLYWGLLVCWVLVWMRFLN
jgi:hypothetical protein